MSDLERKNKISAEALDKVHYMQALLQAALEAGLLTPMELHALQKECLRLLAQQTERYTLGKSSSIPLETAGTLLESIFYCISIELKTAPTPELALQRLKNTPIETLFAHGTHLVKEKTASAARLLNGAASIALNTPHLAYNDTLFHGLPLFFPAYNPQFGAQELPGSIDYPLSNDPMDTVGIEYIAGYIRMFYLENQFCRYFDAETIHALHKSLDPCYEELLINLYEPVLFQALGCIFSHLPPKELHIGEPQRQALQETLFPLSRGELELLLTAALRELYAQFSITSGELKAYLARSASKLPPLLEHALALSRLEGLFPSLLQSPTAPSLRFEEGCVMEDEDFRDLWSDLLACPSPTEKAEMVKSRSKSVTDLIDLFEADCFFGEDYPALFERLSEGELALLTAHLPGHREADLPAEQEWQDALFTFLNSLPAAQRHKIHTLSAQISF